MHKILGEIKIYNDNNDSRNTAGTVSFMALKDKRFFRTMTDQLITVSLQRYVLACPLYRNTKLLLKGN